MTDILVGYYSNTGNTKKMAEVVANGVEDANGNAEIKKIGEINKEDLKSADGIILGSPTYYGSAVKEVFELFEKSNSIRGGLNLKVGAAFASSYHRAGGNETTILSILRAMLIHGMVIVGDPIDTGGHYGAVSIGSPDSQSKDECFALGRRVTEVSRKI